jgi:hypothetical protein
VSILISAPESPKAPAAPEKFEVMLTRIEVRHADKGRWNENGGYLSMYDAEFLDENTIFALYLEDGMRMSHDGGKTWQRMFAESGGIPKGAGYSPSTLEFLDRSTGWAAGSALISTRDGGQTWQNIRVPERMDKLEVKFLNENVGYVAGRGGYCERYTGRCKLWMGVYKTTDGGRTWKKSFRTRENTTPWNIVIVDESIAMITAEGGWLYRTDNGGKSWKTVLDEDYHHVMSIARAGRTLLVIWDQQHPGLGRSRPYMEESRKYR